jgi:hypothetical protein
MDSAGSPNNSPPAYIPKDILKEPSFQQEFPLATRLFAVRKGLERFDPKESGEKLSLVVSGKTDSSSNCSKKTSNIIVYTPSIITRTDAEGTETYGMFYTETHMRLSYLDPANEVKKGTTAREVRLSFDKKSLLGDLFNATDNADDNTAPKNQVIKTLGMSKVPLYWEGKEARYDTELFPTSGTQKAEFVITEDESGEVYEIETSVAVDFSYTTIQPEYREKKPVPNQMDLHNCDLEDLIV